MSKNEMTHSHYAGVNLYSVHDKQAGQYRAPFAMMSDGEAVRAFMDLLSDPNTLCGKHPRDFRLIKVGVWYQDDGVYSPFQFDGVSAEVLVDGGRLGTSAPSKNPSSAAAVEESVAEEEDKDEETV